MASLHTLSHLNLFVSVSKFLGWGKATRRLNKEKRAAVIEKMSD